jgi:ribonuclease P protein component
VGFSVPKKKFRHSVQRHRITRLMREAWRLSKHSLYAAIPADTQLHLFIVYTDTALPDFATVQTVLAKGIERLQTEFKAPNA